MQSAKGMTGAMKGGANRPVASGNLKASKPVRRAMGGRRC